QDAGERGDDGASLHAVLLWCDLTSVTPQVMGRMPRRKRYPIHGTEIGRHNVHRHRAMRRSSFILFSLLAILVCLPPGSAEDGHQQGSLTGLTALQVLVDVPEDEQLEPVLSEATLRKDVESKLKAVGIRILGDTAWQGTPGRPSLKVDVSL